METKIKPSRTITIGLYDYVNKGEPVEKIQITTKEGQKISEACKDFMKTGYGGKIYVETHDHKTNAEKCIKMIFSENSDFFLMFVCLKSK